MYYWLADGEANFYTVSRGIDWSMRIQMNGELSVPQQEFMMNLLVAGLNNKGR